MDLQCGFEAVAPRAVYGRGVRVLWRMVECRVGELVDPRARNCGHSIRDIHHKVARGAVVIR